MSPNWRDRVTLARQVVKALAAIAIDAVASPTGHALPLSSQALTQRAAFADLLKSESRGTSVLSLRPQTITPTPLESPSSNCQNTIFEISWQDAADGPKSLFVKQSCADFPTRLFANVIGFWKIECAFCRDLAQTVPIAMPRIHAVAQCRSRFIIVMENLRERPATRLFVNRDLIEGVDVPRAKRCLRTLARLHASLAGTSAADREHKLPLELHPFLSPSLKPVMLAINRLAVKPCHERAPDLFDDTHMALYQRALDHWETLSHAWYGEPLTLVHGDSHLGNFFETGDEMGMIDFQGAHWSKGVRDVQYFLINSMRPEQLAAHEPDLVATYCEEMARLGVSLSSDEAWEQYRGFSFQTLMTAVVSLGLGSFTDSNDVMYTMLGRATIAIRRLEFEGWLEDRIERTAGGEVG